MKKSEYLNNKNTCTDDISNFFYCFFFIALMTVIFTILHENALYRTNLAKNYSWDIKTISNIGMNEYKVYRPRNFYEISLPINHFEKRTFTCNAKLYNFCKQEYSQQTATLKSVTYYHTQLAPSNNQLYRLKAIEYINENKKLLEVDTSLIHPNTQSEISKNSNKLWAILTGGFIICLFSIYWISTLKFTPIQFRVFISLTIIIYYFFKLYKTAIVYF